MWMIFSTSPGYRAADLRRLGLFANILDVSDGKLDYSNIITSVVTVDSARNYYDAGGTRRDKMKALIDDVLAKLDAQPGFSDLLSGVTKEPDGSVTAFNIFYAGSQPPGHLWPHKSSYIGDMTVDGVKFGTYQVTHLGEVVDDMYIGVFAHENGHMLFGWSDLYPYAGEDQTAHVGTWCLMASTNNRYPQMPNPYYRDLEGWITTVDPSVNTLPINGHTAAILKRGEWERHYVEAREKSSVVRSRNSHIPGSIGNKGLAIWHVHALGNNSHPTSTNAPHPLVRIIQADGNGNIDDGDLFRAGQEFNGTGTHHKYYDDEDIPMTITDINTAGSSAITFTGSVLDTPPPPTPMTWKVGSSDPSDVVAELHDGGIMIISGTGKMKNYTDFRDVPWYNHRHLITAAIIEDGVTNVGAFSFSYAENLADVTFGSDVNTIGTYAFSYCKGLKTVTIPGSVKVMGGYAFGRSGVTTLNISTGAVLGQQAFQDCADLETVTIPANVTLDAYVFNKSGLTTLILSEGVTSLRHLAFQGCDSLTTIISLSGNPPVSTSGSKPFNLIPASQITLYVPSIAIRNYATGAATAWWREYTPIGLQDLSDLSVNNFIDDESLTYTPTFTPATTTYTLDAAAEDDVVITAIPAYPGAVVSGNGRTAFDAERNDLQINVTAFGITKTYTLKDPPKHVVTVSGGTGGGEFYRGQSVTVDAMLPSECHTFVNWVISGGGSVTLLTDTAFAATFIMPDRPITVTAVFAHDNHAMSDDPIVIPATCTDMGSSTVLCTRLGCTHKVETAIAALGHAMDTASVVVPATCTSAGSETQSCTRVGCTHKVETAIAALGHAMGTASVVIPATCTSVGSETQSCTRVGCTHKVETPIAKDTAAHAWSSVYRVLAEANCDAPGSEVLYCTRDGCGKHNAVSVRQIAQITEGCNSILTNDRNIPQIKSDEDASVIPPTVAPSFKLSVGSNPVQKSDGAMKIFASGKSIASGTLTIYDAAGNVVRKINIIETRHALPLRANDNPRAIAEWDLCDASGRTVSAGTYLLRGVVTTADGNRERVSVVLGVR